jgi:hypothetical protein
MLYFYFVSPQFQSILPRCKTINKICGRYYFTERFQFDKFDLNKNLIRYRERPAIPPYFDTRYFRMSREGFEPFWNAFQKYVNEKPNEVYGCSVENLFYVEKFFKVEDCIHDQQIGVGGFFACNGHYIED